MKVTLAYNLLGHRPDETIEVDDAVGRRMVREGLARLPDDEKGEDIDPSREVTVLPTGRTNPTVGDVKALAEARGVSVQEAKKMFAAELRGESADTGKDNK